jgi:demethylmacrocin O-methyltransferase
MTARRVQRRVRQLAARFLSAQQRQRLKQVAVALRTPRSGDLDALARFYGTDKGSQDFGIAVGHNYTPLYEHHFGPRRKAVRSVLEIGVGGTSSVEGYETPAGGQSLLMWSRYFPNATILGIDIFDKAITGTRIRFERGDAADADFLRRLIDRYGPFDIVVDDGSHVGREIIASFEVLWDAVQPGGLYVIEDLSLAYHERWEGGPPGTPGTAADLVKRLVDSTLLRAGDPFRPTVAALHLYSEIVFLQRSPE